MSCLRFILSSSYNIFVKDVDGSIMLDPLKFEIK